MDEKSLDLKFLLETTKVAEIIIDDDNEDKWSGDDVESIDDIDLQEMVKHDEKPYFIEFTALYTGLSGNNRHYTEDAVKSCVAAMPGVNMYKGHEEPGTNDWKYREPVGKVVAARVSSVTVDGQRVLAAKGKAYITEADTKLRSDIARKMAGPLSILGNARAIRQLGSSKKTITKIHNLKSIDFCNPGTNGMSLAGVTAIVKEMSGDPVATPGEPKKEPKMDELTKEQLLAKYGSLINTIVGEQMSEQVVEMAAEKKLVAEQKIELESKQADHDTVIAEMKTKNEGLQKEVDTLKDEIGKRDNELLKSELDKFILTSVKEMKDDDKHNEEIVEMASSDISAEVVDDDLEKSKTAFSEKLSKSVEKIEKLAEMMGGPGNNDETPSKNHSKNQNRNKSNDMLSKILSPDLQVAGKDKE